MVETIHLTESSPETSQVQHSAILPKERMYGRNPGGVIGNRISIRKSHNLTAFVHILAKAVGPTQSAEVAHYSVLQRKARVWVPKPARENGSGIALAAIPVTWPLLLMVK